MKTVGCCIPLTWEMVPRQFFFSFCSMLMYSFGKYHMVVMTSRAASIARMQEKMIEKALEDNVDYVLHLDADQVYPADTPERLMKHIDDGKDVVFGLVPRHSDGGYVAYTMEDDPLRIEQMDIKPDSGLVRVGCTGFGGLMVNPKVFEKIDKPYYSILSVEYGPDFSFCYQCNKKGVEMWVDTSLRYGHILPHVKYNG